MKAVTHSTTTRTLNADPAWDHKVLPIGALPVTDIKPGGVPGIESYWQLDAAELAILNAGGLLCLAVLGESMPPVSIIAAPAEVLPAKFAIGDIVRSTDPQYVLRSGSDAYDHAIVVHLDPLVLVSMGADMKWEATVQADKLEAFARAGDGQLLRARRRLSAEQANDGWQPAIKNVLQPWVLTISFMQQSVLLTAVRGPDGLPKYGAVKMLLRWYRRCFLMSSMDGCVIPDPIDNRGGSFMGPSLDGPCDMDPWSDRMQAHVNQYLKDLDAIPHHFQMHFMHAAEILGYKHPDAAIRLFWHQLYKRLVHDMHVWEETEDQLDHRLGDVRAHWLERADPATVA